MTVTYSASALRARLHAASGGAVVGGETFPRSSDRAIFVCLGGIGPSRPSFAVGAFGLGPSYDRDLLYQ